MTTSASSQDPSVPLLLQWGTLQAADPGPALGVDAGFSITPSPDGSALSVLFGVLSGGGPTLAAGLQAGSDDARMSSERFVGFHVPVTLQQNGTNAGKRLRGFATDMRLFVQKDADTRILIVADLGGGRKVWEWGYGSAVKGENITQTVVGRGLSVRPGASSATYVANLLILLQRRIFSSTGMVQIDSLDITPDIR